MCYIKYPARVIFGLAYLRIVGETGRRLCTRVKGNLDGLIKCNAFTPLGAHRRLHRNNAFFQILVSILARESEISARKTIEAPLIAVKSTKMNGKDECNTTTSGPMRYLDLWGLWSIPAQRRRPPFFELKRR